MFSVSSCVARYCLVIAILIMLAGVLAIRTLPVGQYPDVAPPAVKISATYTGASAETLENSVTQVIEQQLTGLDHLLYSAPPAAPTARSASPSPLSRGPTRTPPRCRCKTKCSSGIAAAERSPAVRVTVEKSQSSFLLILAVYDKTNRATSSDISDWLVSNMQDPLARVEGVGSLQVFGAEYAMRVWMDPTKTRLLLADAFRRPVGD
ncbi:RND efflux system, inner membrane transporter CmeB [Klebsiella pneumoniae]|uniref:RND efflux system, inner membrane transporter CmeB n=1 Tax=Klebsiella pneumoniae TaxID=573 RepID=A0A2X3CXJ3_KLEPN|nr:RND efflux system, inner membrane transporter CmeB [Klebsiella pneumoniae]